MLNRFFTSVLLIFTLLLVPISSSADVVPEKTALQEVNEVLGATLFFDLSFGAFDRPEVDRDGNPVLNSKGIQETKRVKVPFVLVVLLGGGIFFTFFYGFINIRGFKHAIQVVRGRYDKEGDEGEVSHFKALTSALSATIGLGNIAGVAIAIQLGGPGAAVWMVITAFFGMCSKFHSCTLSQFYRRVNPDGSISGGPMYYLDLGLRNSGQALATIGKVFAILYGIFVCLAAIGGGCMFQVNQTVEAFNVAFGVPKDSNWIIGLVIAFLVGVVILGGIKKIAGATSKIVPLMFVIYMTAGAFVVFANIDNLIPSILLMLKMAFTDNAVFGGFVGVLIMGIQRGSFSNEAGVGSAAIVHAAAKTNEPVREGLVAMLGPFIDTIVVCFMTSLVVIVTGTYANPDIIAQGGNIGITITSEAFRTVIPWFPYVLTICVALFAYSSMISWCYYGERGWIYIMDHFNDLGLKTVVIYRIIFIALIMLGAISSLTEVINFTDYVFLSLAVPNILGSLFLAKQVRAKAKDYMRRLEAGQM